MGLNQISLFDEVLERVKGSSELERILTMPRRDPEKLGRAIAQPLTDRLRLPGEVPTGIPKSLYWHQALALAEAHDFRGALVPLPVGAGKTLITALLPTVMGAKRPVLLVPAKLGQKTREDLAELALYWRVHPNIEIVHYELLSRRPELLIQLGPDLVIADEAYKLKNPKAAVTKRLWRYMRQYEGTPLVCLTGTVQKKGFRDWWHIQRGCLPEGLCILPHNWNEMMEWDQALAPGLKNRRPLGALSRIGGSNAEEVRASFGKIFRETPAIITYPGASCDASILVDVKKLDCPGIDELVGPMRETWETPDGVPFSEGVDLWRHARELANGYYYRWKVPGPPEWMDARREFNSFIREVLKHSRKWDTMLQVVKANPGHAAITHWRGIKDSFTPDREPVWCTDVVIETAAAEAKKKNALVWVEHVAAGQRIEQLYGIPYFGQMGLTKDKKSIKQHPGGPACVSVSAVGEGFNLQDRWDYNIVLNAPPSCVTWEQFMGRTHRNGQQADLVTFKVLTCVQEQTQGFDKACAQALAAQQTDSQAKKLCLADIVYS